ncbi:phytanoyl-CoA dioxygenase family protein [Actinomadura sp. KC345]|uniref:phytanoyl-CoA dioxygenase family protein n=1 Tax=Actinomadura sp. KC345 TaxID=2530371 RepID=UPI001047B016|nr:phytanoyl-CoA dioxygenase family protein [Actinomadura sp. KC345]TDC41954.1 phytanoyl-CoA dioxygenase family protein [Actinomadura sp. KC345]
MVATGERPTPESVTADTVRRYNDQGFIHLPGVLPKEEVKRYREAAEALFEREGRQIWGASEREVQIHYVEAAWRKDEAMRDLALHPVITEIAERLAGGPLRLYGTDVLMKEPEEHLPTVVHDDEPGLPLSNLSRTLTAWTPLVDVPAERGCLTYIPGSHLRPDADRQIHLTGFSEYRPMEDIWPDYSWQPRVTVPVRAGDVVFHHFRTVHLADVNRSDEPRIAYGVVYMDADAVYRPGVQDHPVAHLEPGQPVGGESFPLIRAQR